MRGVEQAPDLLEVAGARGRRRWRRRGAFSVRTWRARARSGSGRSSIVGRLAQRGDAQRLARLAALARGARCSPSSAIECTAPESSVDQRPAPQVERHRLERRASRSRSARRARARCTATASWSSSPVWAPTQSFSTREQSFGELDAGRARARPPRPAAPGTARSPARPRTRGRRPARGRSRSSAGTGAARGRPPLSSATAPRTNARQPSARSGAASANSSSSPRSSARASMRSPDSGSAVTVTPRSIANGSASPSL